MFRSNSWTVVFDKNSNRHALRVLDAQELDAYGPTFAHGVGCIRYEIGDSLLQFTSEPYDGRAFSELTLHGEVLSLELVGMHLEYIVNKLSDIDTFWGLRLA